MSRISGNLIHRRSSRVSWRGHLLSWCIATAFFCSTTAADYRFDWRRSVELGVRSESLGEYHEAILLYRHAINCILEHEDRTAADNINAGRTLARLARTYIRVSDGQSSTRVIEEARAIVAEFDEVPIRLNIELSLAECDLLKIEGKLNEAIQVILDAQRLIAVVDVDDDLEVQVHVTAAITHRLRGELRLALQNAELAMHKVTQSQEPSTLQTADVYFELGVIHGSRGDYNKSLELLLKSRRIISEGAAHPPRLLSIDIQIAKLHVVFGDLLKARDSNENASKSFRHDRMQTHTRYFDLLYAQSIIYAKLQDWERAISACKDLDRHLSNTTICRDLHIENLHNLAYLMHEIGDSESSIDYCDRAVESIENRLPTNAPVRGHKLFDVAIVYCRLGEHEAAIDSLEMALEVFESCDGQLDYHLQTLNGLVRLKTKSGALSDAEKDVERLSLAAKNLPEEEVVEKLGPEINEVLQLRAKLREKQGISVQKVSTD
jgi:tetratricopeptide (TPR) repeat protein